MSPEPQVLAADTRNTASIHGKLVVAALFAIAIAAFYSFDLSTYLSLNVLKANRDRLLVFTDDHYVPAVLLFIVLYIVQTAFSLPGATLMTLAGGFLFGSLWAALYVNIGATAGATLAFLAARYLFRDWVEQRFGHRLEAFQAGFAQNAFNYVLTLRLIPLFPFWLVNLVAAVTRMRLRTYVAATFVGIVPGCLVFVSLGNGLDQIVAAGTAADAGIMLRPAVWLPMVGLAVLALLPVAWRRLHR